MKIVHCLIHYFPFHFAGTEVYTHTLAKLQQNDGYIVAVITPFIEYLSPGNMVEHYQYDGIDVYQFKETGNPHLQDIYTGKIKPEGLNNFLVTLKKLNPDIVHFHELNLSNSFTINHVKIAKQFGAKVFITMHLSFLTCNTNILIRQKKLCSGKIDQYDCTACSYNTFFKIPGFIASPLAAAGNLFALTGGINLLRPGKFKTFFSIPLIIRRKKNDLVETIKYTDKFIAIAEWYKKILLTNGVPESKIAVIPQGLPMVSCNRTVILKKVIQLPIKLVFVGRIQPQKGVHILIKAVQQFTKESITLDIFGREENSPYYRDCVAESAKTNNISVKGFLNNVDVTETLSKYDMFCLPSLFSEMSPLVIQEAFASGLPVLASKVYGNMEQVQHGKNGLLFDFNSLESLTEQLNSLVTDSELLISLQKNITPPISFADINKQYIKLYAS